MLEALFARYDIRFVRAIITDHFFIAGPGCRLPQQAMSNRYLVGTGRSPE